MPLALDQDLIAKIETATKAGEWPTQAAKRLGATPRQAAAWMALGEKLRDEGGEDWNAHERLCVELVSRVWIAEAECESNWRKLWLKSLADGKAGLWQGYANMLERRFPDRWRKREMEKGVAKQVSPEEEFRKMAEESRADRP